MIVSSQDVKQFLLDLIDQASYPGKMIEFVVAVKQEIAAADVGGDDVTAADRMFSHQHEPHKL